MTPADPRWARWEPPALGVTLLLALGLRLNNYTLAPLPTDNEDELDWAWSGLGIITRGVPYGWSNLRAYTDHLQVAANGTTFAVTHPFLDHPPLFSLMVGVVAWLQGARQLGDVTMLMIRPLPILLSLLALLLLYVLGRRLLDPPSALAGTILLATAPAAVLVQRQVEAEALLAPLMLGALIGVHRLLSGDGRRRWAVLLLAACAAAPLAKVSGIAVAGGVAAVALGSGRWRLALAAAGAGVLGIAAFFVYGIAYNPGLFFRVISESETRRYGVMGVFQFIAALSGPSGAVRHLRDGWWLLGWIGAGALLGRARTLRSDLLLWPLAAYAVVIMLAAEGIQDYGWFRVAVYPLVYLLAGWLAWMAVSRPSPLVLLVVLVLGGAASTSSLFGSAPNGWAPSAFLLAGVLSVVLLPGLVATWRPESRTAVLAARAGGAAALLFVVGCNVATSIQLDTLYYHL